MADFMFPNIVYRATVCRTGATSEPLYYTRIIIRFLTPVDFRDMVFIHKIVFQTHTWTAWRQKICLCNCCIANLQTRENTIQLLTTLLKHDECLGITYSALNYVDLWIFCPIKWPDREKKNRFLGVLPLLGI